jgi:hypothetical protein
MALMKRKNAPHAHSGMASMVARSENMAAELGGARARRASGEFEIGIRPGIFHRQEGRDELAGRGKPL